MESSLSVRGYVPWTFIWFLVYCWKDFTITTFYFGSLRVTKMTTKMDPDCTFDLKKKMLLLGCDLSFYLFIHSLQFFWRKDKSRLFLQQNNKRSPSVGEHMGLQSSFLFCQRGGGAAFGRGIRLSKERREIYMFL